MKRYRTNLPLWITLVIAMFALGACQQNNTPDDSHEGHDHAEVAGQETAEQDHEAPEAQEHDHSGDGLHAIQESLGQGEVLVTERQRKNVGIRLGAISREQLTQLVKAFGEVVLPPSGKATVSSVMGGVVRNIEMIEGDYVQKGQMIARIEHPDVVDMQERFLEARNTHEYLQVEYERQKTLFRDSVNSAKTYQEVKSRYQTNQARLQSLKKKLQLLNINPAGLTPETITRSFPVVAPMSGYVADIFVNTGRHISSQQELFHITDNERAHIDLQVYEKDLTSIKEGQRLTFNLSNSPLDRPLEGTVMKKARRFSPESRTALVHAEIAEMNDNLLPGMSVICHVQTGGKQEQALPEEAFESDEGKDYVFVLEQAGELEARDGHGTEEEHDHGTETHEENSHDPEKYYIFRRLEVRKGLTEAGLTGLDFINAPAEGAQYAVNNAQALLSEMKKTSGGTGHGHAH